MIKFYFRNGFSFCRGEIGIDDFSPYLSKLPKIDFVYCGLPKPEYFRYWYRDAGIEPKITYERYIELLGGIILELDSTEYHLEVNAGNRDLVLDLFRGRNYTVQSMPILYSAPIDSISERYAKKRKIDEMLVLSRDTIDLPASAKYSHEYLDFILRDKKGLNCFDPAIGKGLLVKFCLKHGHTAHGIDMNSDRLRVAMEMLK